MSSFHAPARVPASPWSCSAAPLGPPVVTHKFPRQTSALARHLLQQISAPLPFPHQDEALNELLPFGEYVPTDAPLGEVGEEGWELERLLLRLAAVGHRQERRAARRAARRSTVPTAPQPIAERGPSHRLQRAEAAAEAGRLSPDCPSTPARAGPAFPASWPPAGEGAQAAASSSRLRNGENDADQTPSLAPSSSFKSRLAKLKFRCGPFGLLCVQAGREGAPRVDYVDSKCNVCLSWQSRPADEYSYCAADASGWYIVYLKLHYSPAGSRSTRLLRS